MLSTMQDGPLLISGILRHGQQVYGESRVITITGPAASRWRGQLHADVARRAEQLAKALGRLGIGDSDRVGTFLWNNQSHLEAYLAVPAMGAVLHTLNLRLFPEQLAYVINHAEDQVIICDASIAGLLARVRDQIPTVRHIIVVGDGDTSAPSATPWTTRSCWPPRSPATTGPELDERQAAAMCYTSGTTGQPQGCRLQPPLDVPAHHGHHRRRLARHQRAGQRAVHRADVPRQRLGHPLRRRS